MRNESAAVAAEAVGTVATGRRLALGVAPAVDETLISIIDRIAARYGATRESIMHAAGLLDGRKPFPGFGIFMSDEQSRRFAQATGLAPEIVRGSLVSALAGIVFDDDGTNQRPDSLQERTRQIGIQTWLYLHGSPYCPKCLDDSHGIWKLSWRNPWSIACLRHRCLLVESCPECGSDTKRIQEVLPAAGTRARGLGLPINIPARLGCCNDLVRDQDGRRPGGRWRGRCWAELTAHPIIPLEPDDPLMEAQRVVEEASSRRSVVVLGEYVSAVEFFRHARALAALAMRAAEVADLGPLPIVVEEAFERFAGHRASLSTTKWFQQTPRSTFHMAAVAPTVIGALSQRSIHDARRCFEPVAARLTNRYGRDLRSRYRQTGLTASIVLAPEENPRRGACLSEWMGEPVAYRPEHVPQLLWREAWDGLFASDFVRAYPNQAPRRRFLSILLARVSWQLTWQEAAAALGLGPDDARSACAYYGSTALRSLPKDALWARLARVGRAMNRAPVKVDYAHRRAHFAEWADFQDQQWRSLCDSAGVLPGHGAKRRNCAVWLWAELTGGPLSHAPACSRPARTRERFAPLSRDTFWASYAAFHKDRLPPFREPLSQLGVAMAAQADGFLEPLPDERRLLRPIVSSDLL